jgi:hypothetical protein
MLRHSVSHHNSRLHWLQRPRGPALHVSGPGCPEFQPVRKRKARTQAGQINRSTAFAWLRRPVKARSGDWTCLVLAPRTLDALAWPFNLDFPLRPGL